MDIKEAIAFLKASGYTVSKPREKKLKTVGPTFVAHWIDGVVTRMSIHTIDENPDLKRAIRVSYAAYESRTKGQGQALTISKGHFVRGDHVIKSFGETGVMEYLA